MYQQFIERPVTSLAEKANGTFKPALSRREMEEY